MKGTFRPSTAEDLPQIAGLLRRAFAGSAPVAPDLMTWKYWSKREDWSEPRSYVYEKDGAIVAHAGLWPVTFPGQERPVRGIQMIDWASSPDSPGAGVAVLQKLVQLFDFIYSIGGSEATRRVLPSFGFGEAARAWTGARPLRPLRQILTHQRRGWKLAPRLIRNWMWSRGAAGQGTEGWHAAEVDPPKLSADLGIDPVFSRRGRAFFEYLGRCPAVPFRIYEIRRDEASLGYFVLGLSRGQARLAGLWLREAGPKPWRIALTLAQGAARGWPGANEFAAMGSLGPSAEAAVQSGLRLLRETPVYLLSRKGFRFPENYQFQMADDDAAFLDPGEANYLT